MRYWYLFVLREGFDVKPSFPNAASVCKTAETKTNVTNAYLLYYRVFAMMLNTMTPFTCETFQVTVCLNKNHDEIQH